MTKDLKHDLGQALCESSLRALKLVVFANGSERKDAPLRDLALEIEAQWIYLRLAHDLKGVSLGQFKLLGERVTCLITEALVFLSRKILSCKICSLGIAEQQVGVLQGSFFGLRRPTLTIAIMRGTSMVMRGT